MNPVAAAADDPLQGRFNGLDVGWNPDILFMERPLSPPKSICHPFSSQCLFYTPSQDLRCTYTTRHYRRTIARGRGGVGLVGGASPTSIVLMKWPSAQPVFIISHAASDWADISAALSAPATKGWGWSGAECCGVCVLCDSGGQLMMVPAGRARHCAGGARRLLICSFFQAKREACDQSSCGSVSGLRSHRCPIKSWSSSFL